MSTRDPAATPGAKIDIEVDSVPAGAQVLVDGAVLGKTPFHGALPSRSGTTTVVLRLDGYGEKRVVVRGDQPVKERVKLGRLAPARRDADRDKSVNPFDE